MIRVVFVVWVLKLRRLVIGGWLIHGLQPKGGSAAGYIGRSGRRLPELVEPSSKSKKCGESLKAFLSLAIRGLQSDCARSCAAWGGYHPGHPSTVTKEWHDLRCSTRRYARVPRSLATAHRPSFPLRPIRKSTSWAPPASAMFAAAAPSSPRVFRPSSSTIGLWPTWTARPATAAASFRAVPIPSAASRLARRCRVPSWISPSSAPCARMVRWMIGSWPSCWPIPIWSNAPCFRALWYNRAARPQQLPGSR